MSFLKQSIMWVNFDSTVNLQQKNVLHKGHCYNNGDEVHVTIDLGRNNSITGVLLPNRKKDRDPSLSKQPDYFGRIKTAEGIIKILGWFNYTKSSKQSQKTGIRVIFTE